MKIILSLICPLLFSFSAPCFSEPRDEVIYTGSFKNGAWTEQLELHFSIPRSVNVTQNFKKEMVCTQWENVIDDERASGPCLAWECRAFLSVPLKAVLSLQYGDDFTSPSYFDLSTLGYWIRQKDCQNLFLEINASQVLHSETPNRSWAGVKTGSSTTFADYQTNVSATLMPGAEPGSARLTNFTFDETYAGLVDPDVRLFESHGTLRRLNHLDSEKLIFHNMRDARRKSQRFFNIDGPEDERLALSFFFRAPSFAVVCRSE